MACCTPGSSPRWQAERRLAPVGAQMNVMYAVAVALIGRTRTYHRTSYDALPVEDELTTRVVVRLKDRRLENHRRVPGPQLAGRANCR